MDVDPVLCLRAGSPWGGGGVGRGTVSPRVRKAVTCQSIKNTENKKIQ